MQVDRRGAFCDAARVAIVGERSDPVRLLDRLDEIDRSELDESSRDRMASALRAGRAAFERSVRPDGGWDWDSAPLVGAVNDICHTDLDATTFMAIA